MSPVTLYLKDLLSLEAEDSRSQWSCCSILDQLIELVFQYHSETGFKELGKMLHKCTTVLHIYIICKLKDILIKKNDSRTPHGVRRKKRKN